ncbi:MAG: hypothetical protein QM487_14530 [Candidatus Marithrix sp.]
MKNYLRKSFIGILLLLVGSYCFADVVPSDDSCVASYSPKDGKLHIPCLFVSDDSASGKLYEVELDQNQQVYNFDLNMDSIVIKEEKANTISDIKTMQIMMVSHLASGITFEDTIPYSKKEAKKAWEYYTTGRYRQMYGRLDEGGVVVIMEAKSMEEAYKAVDQMPLVKNGLVEYDLIPLGSFFPWTSLFDALDTNEVIVAKDPKSDGLNNIETNQILMISHLAPGVTLEDTMPYNRDEAKLAWEYYTTGKYRQMFGRLDEGGVVVIMEAKNIEEAHKSVKLMPLVNNGMVEYELIPLGYFFPLSALFNK